MGVRPQGIIVKYLLFFFSRGRAISSQGKQHNRTIEGPFDGARPPEAKDELAPFRGQTDRQRGLGQRDTFLVLAVENPQNASAKEGGAALQISNQIDYLDHMSQNVQIK